jgi:mitogen-activated protein kinase kinase kinase 7
MLRGAKCVVDDFTDGGDFHLAMWANGGDTTSAIPEIRLIEHKWEESNTAYLVYAIHTMSEDSEPAYDECNVNGYGSLVVPCYPLESLTVAKNAGKVEPTQSTWVDAWVTNVMSANNTNGTDSGSGISMYVWVGIGGGALLLIVIGVGVGCFICRSRRKAARDKLDSPTENHGGDLYAGAGGGTYGDNEYGPGNHYQPYNHLVTPQFACDTDTGRPTASSGDDNVSQRQGSSINRTSVALIASQPSYNVDDVDSGGSNNVVTKMLRDDPVLGNKRMPFENLSFKRLMSKGAFGEVWVCEYTPVFGHSQEVAVKRLLQDRAHKFDEIQDFANEIQLTASLSHPNVVETIGVAWNTLDNLVLVMEYIAFGDLQNYLKKHGDLLSWARDKIHIAIGIARAIEYLHSIRPLLIHRDLKSKNVLLTRDLFPKVIDFGATRRRVEETMTAGVGTPYWTAPEVLSGERYTEQSDIYSFGVMLSELDTCRLPYYDAVDAKGGKLQPFRVLEGVMSGVLRPSFSHECPQRVRRLGVACLQHDPRRRPSALELVDVLGG